MSIFQERLGRVPIPCRCLRAVLVLGLATVLLVGCKSKNRLAKAGRDSKAGDVSPAPRRPVSPAGKPRTPKGPAVQVTGSTRGSPGAAGPRSIDESLCPRSMRDPFKPLALRRFAVGFALKTRRARWVTLVGEFNGWSPLRMRLGRDGVFRRKVMVLPGEHRYFYKVDGVPMPDPGAPRGKTYWRYQTSLLKVGSPGQVRMVRACRKARSRHLAGYGKKVAKLHLLRRRMSGEAFSFVALGDSRSRTMRRYKEVLGWVNVVRPAPDLVLHTGDAISHPGSVEEWTLFARLTMALRIPMLMVAGNHDYRTVEHEKLLLAIAPRPGGRSWFSHSHGDVLFIGLDSHNSTRRGQWLRIKGEQLRWLTQTLGRARHRYVVVFLHHPLYPTEDSHHRRGCLNRFPRDRDRLARLLRRARVSVVFAGHDHRYHRWRRHGVLQVITGGAGAPLYAKPSKGGFRHFVLCGVNTKQMECRTVDSQGRVRDRFVLQPRG